MYSEFTAFLIKAKRNINLTPQEVGWYKDAIVYSLYVDLFNNDFSGLSEKLPYLSQLGINCLWLLPILDSPMRDAGFDIRDYRKIRPDLTGNIQDDTEAMKIFTRFLDEAHSRGIRVIFDIALNHTSEEHAWFRQSRTGPGDSFRDFYIWNKDDRKYSGARLLFKGMCPSNWEKDGDSYFFHRFFEFQPDLNYRNPAVFAAMAGNLVYWLQAGIDGFRADAIPYLWKEEGTNCENLPETHLIVKMFRIIIDYLRPNTLLLAEACQPPKEVVKYFGDNDECHAGYHFPIMPQIFKAMAIESADPIITTLGPEITPAINPDNQWFMFLRLHDELTLEMVTPEDRRIIHSYYCRDPRWDFRVGEGISARLAELMEGDPRRIGLAFSIMFTLPGTPLIYYGDEYGRFNDEEYYEMMKARTGYNDTRYFVRGEMDWESAGKGLNNTGSYENQVFTRIQKQIEVRKRFKCFGRGSIQWVGDTSDVINFPAEAILAFHRRYGNEDILVIHNLGSEPASIVLSPGFPVALKTDLLGQALASDGSELNILPYGYHWIKL